MNKLISILFLLCLLPNTLFTQTFDLLSAFKSGRTFNYFYSVKQTRTWQSPEDTTHNFIGNITVKVKSIDTVFSAHEIIFTIETKKQGIEYSEIHGNCDTTFINKLSIDSIIENLDINYYAGIHYIKGWVLIDSITTKPSLPIPDLIRYPYSKLFRYYRFPNQDSIFLENKRLTINAYYSVYGYGNLYQYIFSADSGLVEYNFDDIDSFLVPINIKCSLMNIQTDIKESKGKPDNFNISQNFPNPFNPSTTIKYYIPSLSQVSVTIYDLLGKEIIRLVDKQYQLGECSITWNGRNKNGYLLPSGAYFYKLLYGSNYIIKKMNLIK